MDSRLKTAGMTYFRNYFQILRTALTDQKTANKSKIGVILLNLGGPDSLQAVRPFLYNLFSDRQIIRLGPGFMQKPLARLISTVRSKKTEKFYSLIGGKSPISEITNAQAKALEDSLNSSPFTHHASLSFRVYAGMRYWHPFIEDVIPVIYRDGIRRLVALSLYPHYSIATSGSSLSKVEEVVAGFPIEMSCISSWYDHPLYIEALVDVIKKGIESFDGNSNRGSEVHVLFSAHSMPQKIIEQGDPYVDQIMATIRKISEVVPMRWCLSYQSRSGPVKWLGPSTDTKLSELAAEGIKKVLVVPISFVSDHIETLYEIDILYKDLAKELKIDLRRTASLNTHPVFIEALKELVRKGLKEKSWDKSTSLS
jgi:ferrochelatase